MFMDVYPIVVHAVGPPFGHVGFVEVIQLG